MLFYKQGNERQAIRPSHLTHSGIIGESELSFPTIERTGQANGLSDATDRAAEQDNGLGHPNEESTRYTNGFGFPTEGATSGQTNKVALVTNEQANRTTFPERGTAQSNELTPIAEVGAGQLNELSRSAWEGTVHANGLSYPGQSNEEAADKTSGQANGVSDSTLGGDQLFNGPRQLTHAGAGQNNGQHHPSHSIDAETIRSGHPSEESAEQPDGLIPPLDDENGQENTDETNNPIQETGVEHSSQRPAIFGNQAGRLNVSVQETGQPNSHGLPSWSHQISNNQSMNAASREQATVHTCSMEELMLWKQQLNRYVL